MACGENFAHRIVQSGLRLESTILSTTCDFYVWFHFISVPGPQIQLAEMPLVCLCVTLWLVFISYRSLALIAAGAGRDGRLPSTPQRPFHHGSWFKFRFRFRFWLWYRRWFRGSCHIWQNTIHTIVHNTAVYHWSEETPTDEQVTVSQCHSLHPSPGVVLTYLCTTLYAVSCSITRHTFCYTSYQCSWHTCI